MRAICATSPANKFRGEEALIDTPIDISRLNPDLIARFGEETEALWPRDIRTGPLGLAVSGGPDSLALLLLAQAAMPGEISVLSIDHGLRAAAAEEAAMVGRICAQLDVPFTAMTVAVGPGNVQAKARDARYAALRKWSGALDIGAVATAHHADDQAETLLMRLARGSGLAGLAGVRSWGSLPDCETPLIRPLLWARKTELEALVADAGITPALDPSNANRAFDRVRVRQHLAEHDWLDAEALAASAGHLAEGWRALEWYAQADWEEMVTREDSASCPTYQYYANVPRVIQIETVCRIVSELGGRVSRSEAGRAADRLWRGQNASLGGVLAAASVEKVAKVGVEMRVWRFSTEPPRRQH
jgi:tRNA(Ile)-lysidine synthase